MVELMSVHLEIRVVLVEGEPPTAIPPAILQVQGPQVKDTQEDLVVLQVVQAVVAVQVLSVVQVQGLLVVLAE
jgi:hypothetical protein